MNMRAAAASPTLAATGADPAFEREVIAPLRGQGRRLVAAQYGEFHALLREIPALLDQRRFSRAAVALQVAANHATLWHGGIFTSPELERLVARLGAAALPGKAAPRTRPGEPRRVLHVATRVGPVGGHARMMARWIAADTDSRHRIILTRQQDPMPDFLTAAARASGGGIDQVNRRPGGLLAWARALQAEMATADLVVLHVHNMDILPFLAMAGLAARPPVALLNHGDHLFFVGAGFVDAVVNTRGSGLRLARDRRGVEPSRNLLLPLCLSSAPAATDLERAAQRQAVRAELGIAQDAVVILSIARAPKYRDVGPVTFADTILPILRAHPGAHLLVVGPGGGVDWSAAEAAAPGRVHALPERPDTARFLAAGDVYVDSFPFVSITSMFEAGLSGLPLVTRYPFGPGCDVLGSDSPGLDPVIQTCRDAAAFQAALGALVADPALRRLRGDAARAEIGRINQGPGWRAALEDVYRQAADLPRNPGPISRPPRRDDVAGTHDLDLLSPYVYGDQALGGTADGRLAFSAELELKAAPLGWRLRRLSRLAAAGQLRIHPGRAAWRYLVPEWAGRWLRRHAPRR